MVAPVCEVDGEHERRGDDGPHAELRSVLGGRAGDVAGGAGLAAEVAQLQHCTEHTAATESSRAKNNGNQSTCHKIATREPARPAKILRKHAREEVGRNALSG